MIPELRINIDNYEEVKDEKDRPYYWSMTIRTSLESGLVLTSPITVFRNQVRKYDKKSVILEAFRQTLNGQLSVILDRMVEDDNNDDGHNTPEDTSDQT